MKILIWVVLSGLGLCSCSRNDVETTISCDSTKEYAKTVSLATQRLVGTWRLASVSTGFQQPPAAPNQVVDFRADGTCVVTRDGQSSPPFSYSLSVGTLAGSPTIMLPQLTVNDATQPSVNFLRLGKSSLFICDEEMVLDYGTAYDGPSSTYRRQAR